MCGKVGVVSQVGQGGRGRGEECRFIGCYSQSQAHAVAEGLWAVGHSRGPLPQQAERHVKTETMALESLKCLQAVMCEGTPPPLSPQASTPTHLAPPPRPTTWFPPPAHHLAPLPLPPAYHLASPAPRLPPGSPRPPPTIWLPAPRPSTRLLATPGQGFGDPHAHPHGSPPSAHPPGSRHTYAIIFVQSPYITFRPAKYGQLLPCMLPDTQHGAEPHMVLSTASWMLVVAGVRLRPVARPEQEVVAPTQVWAGWLSRE